MPEYKFLDVDTDDFIEILVSANFENDLNPSDLTDVLQIISTVLSHELAKKLFIDGLTSVKVSLKTLEVVFRFNKNETKLAGLSSLRLEYISRGQAQFTFWLFARIDRSYRLGEVPFPPDFRHFITFPEEFEL